MYYTDKIDALLIEEICTPVLEKLIAEEYRSGFNDSVATKLRTAIDEATNDELDGDQAEYFWSAICCGDMDLERPSGWRRLGFTETFMILLDLAKEEEKKEGSFVMPDWGTKGT